MISRGLIGRSRAAIFRTPGCVDAISGYEQSARADETNRGQALNGIGTAVRRGQALTRRLLSVARKQPLQPRRLAIPVWADDFQLLRVALGKGISVSVSLEGGLPDVCVDPDEFDLALLNIAVNARDAMQSHGSFRIEVSTTLLQAARAGVQPGSYVRIDLADTGPGLSAEAMARAFEPFFTTKGATGTGLGLAQVRAFCERSDGFCQIKGPESGGATVSVFLPALPASPLVREEADAEVVKTGAAARLLLVEDDDLAADAQAAVLSSLGYTIQRLPTADEALTLLEKPHGFDAVISDIQMPGHASGIDLAEHLHTRQPDLPIVLVTGFVDQAERLRASTHIAFMKPVDATQLDRCLRELIEKRRRRIVAN